MAEQRIQKVLADQGICSRREAERLIAAGKVKVNGHPVTLGDKMDPDYDKVMIDGQTQRIVRKRQYTYIMLHKPRGYLTTRSDDRGRKTVMDLVSDVPAMLRPVGRLDKDSEGLLLMTDDGAFINMLTHPSGGVGKLYRVTVNPRATEQQIIEMSSGVVLDDGVKTRPCVIHVVVDEPGRSVLELIAGLAKKYDVYVITDEVYEHIVYAPHTHTYFAALPDMWERTISCSSLSKTYSVTGWRLGYVIAPAPIIERAKKVHDFLTVGAAAPLQEAIIPGLRFGQDYYDDLLAKYTHKRDLFCKGLDALGLVHNVPQGAYYVLMDISEFGYDSDLKFCEELAAKVGVGAVPGSSFFREPVNHLIRFHFAKKDETLNDALNRLEALRSKIPARAAR